MNPSTTITPELNPSLYEKKQGWDVLKSGAQTTPTTITSKDLSKVIPIQLPTQQPPTDVGNVVVSNNYGVATGLNGYSINDKGQFVAQPPKVDTSKPADTGTVGRMDNLRALLGLAPKQADVISSPEVTAKNAIVEQRQQEVNTAVSQLNAITARQQQAQIMLDKRFAEETGLTKEQKKLQKDTEMAKINYDAAIEALPVQATISAAQGNLALAQQSLDSLTKMKTEKVKNDYDYQKSLYDAISGFVTKEEKITLDKLNKENDREYTEAKEKIKTLGDTKLEIYKNLVLNNAPLSVYQAVNEASNKEDAKPEDIIAAAGSFGGDVKKQLEIKKLQKEINDINPQNSVDIKNLPIAGQNLLASVRNLRFTTVEESKRIIGNITRALAQGDVEGATEELRIFGYQKLKGAQQTDYDLYEGAKASADSALSQIADQNISAGPYKTLLENKKPWLSIQRDKEFVDLKSIIELGQAQLRKGFYGTAVTGTEAANARNFLIVDSDDINTIKWKLTNTSAFLQFVNDAIIARNVGMEKPKLDDYLTYVVKDKQTGQLGVIPRSEYNPEAYEITKQ